MKLVSARVCEYKSIWDSLTFEIGEVTCLVGKNESGKTALLEALYRINPIISDDSEFDVTNDYPRAEVSDYEEDVIDKRREPARVIECKFELQDSELRIVESIFGKKALKDKILSIYRNYPSPHDTEKGTRTFSLNENKEEAIKHLIKNAKIPVDLQKTLLENFDDVNILITELSTTEATEEITHILNILNKINKHGLGWYIYNEMLSSILPKFLYFDEYYQMKGYENIETLKVRLANNELLHSDYPMLGLIGLARLNLEQLLQPESTQDLVNKLEGAGNRLSRKVLQYWSQNKHVHMRFDVRPARPEDPEGMTTGTNIWANIYDSRHMVSTNLGTRSRGFVWFFSFLSWYSQIERENKHNNIILLLDEPGLFLHGKAQGDLLEYIEKELKGKHQVIYTTHSPFMVDSRRFERVRIVQDKGIESSTVIPKEKDGTKVITEVLEANADSLFPLQGALGYEIYQTLFVGKNCLVVEGVSDLLYIQTLTTILERKGRIGLDSGWTITPVGGSDKVPTFVSLLGSQKGLKVATLIDFQKKDSQTITNLFKKKLLKKKNVLTFADFTEGEEADIEDMFGTEFYIRIVNGEYIKELKSEIKVSSLKNRHPRILIKIEDYFNSNPLKSGKSFSHYRPARFLAENILDLEKEIPDDSLDKFENAFLSLNKLL